VPRRIVRHVVWLDCLRDFNFLNSFAVLAVVAYLGAYLLLYLVVLKLHMKAANSPAVQDVQRALRLVRHDPSRYALKLGRCTQ
jgi:hypothetical protein